MAKFTPPNKKANTLRTSLRIPTAMLPHIETDMKDCGFNKKQRSNWLASVIEALLERSDAANLIAEEFILPGSTESIPVTLDTQLNDQMNEVLVQVTEEEGIQKDRSAVIRTAITQRIMARAGMQLSPQETDKTTETTHRNTDDLFGETDNA